MPHISARCFGSLCLPCFAWPWSAGLPVLQEKVAPSWMHLGWECEKFKNGRPRFLVNLLTARFGWLRVPGDELVSDHLTRYRLRFGATGLTKDRLCCKQHGLQHHNSYIQGQPQHLGGVCFILRRNSRSILGGMCCILSSNSYSIWCPSRHGIRLFCFWCVFFISSFFLFDANLLFSDTSAFSSGIFPIVHWIPYFCSQCKILAFLLLYKLTSTPTLTTLLVRFHFQLFWHDAIQWTFSTHGSWVIVRFLFHWEKIRWSPRQLEHAPRPV